MSATNIAYRRVSTFEQNTSRQLTGFPDDFFGKVYEDKCSGKNAERPELEKMRDYARAGDVVYVHSIDRLARNVQDLLAIVGEFVAKGVTVRFESENLVFGGDQKDAGTSKLLLTMLGAIAEFERALIRNRQREGIEIAKREGKYKGRPAVDAKKIDDVKALVASGVPVKRACDQVGIDRSTYYKAVKRAQNNEE